MAATRPAPHADHDTTHASARPAIQAAGVVTFRPGREVLLVHRPKYDDWSFPKGKLERWEHPTAAAVREVAEETGLHVRLGPPLPGQTYLVNGRPKQVHYWTGRVVGDDDVTGYRAGDEIDEVRWVPLADAPALLSYDHDRATLDAALEVRRKTRALIILRHATARARSRWRGDDADRPLLKTGETEAHHLVPLLAAYDASWVLTSPSTRCVQTLQPYAATTGYELDHRKRLSEERATELGVAAVVEELLEDDRGAVLCTHRPVLPMVFEALGLRERQWRPPLDKAEMLVLHVRKQKLVALERHGV